MDEVLQVLHGGKFSPADVPTSSEELRSLPHSCRPVCALFTHSLETGWRLSNLNTVTILCIYIYIYTVSNRVIGFPQHSNFEDKFLKSNPGEERRQQLLPLHCPSAEAQPATHHLLPQGRPHEGRLREFGLGGHDRRHNIPDIPQGLSLPREKRWPCWPSFFG